MDPKLFLALILISCSASLAEEQQRKQGKSKTALELFCIWFLRFSNILLQFFLYFQLCPFKTRNVLAKVDQQALQGNFLNCTFQSHTSKHSGPIEMEFATHQLSAKTRVAKPVEVVLQGNFKSLTKISFCQWYLLKVWYLLLVCCECCQLIHH